MRRRTLDDLALPGETPIRTLARVHHEAYAIESLGLKESGVSMHQFVRLVQAGVLSDKVPATPPKGNPFEIVIRAAEDFAGMSNKQRAAAKDWSADSWRNRLGKQVAARGTQEEVPETIVLPGGLPEKRWGHRSVDDLQHEVQEMFHAPAEAQPVRPLTGLQGYQKDAYVQALERAGMYCKRLGELVGEEMDAAMGGDVVAGRIKKIRQKVSQAIKEGWSKDKLAQELHVVGGWERDWRRVAETELQGAYNDAAILAAVKQQGPGAKVARIPETTACHDCKRLLLQDGKPIVFSVIALVKNGTNVDVPKHLWKATIWPIHPRCHPAGTLVHTSGGDVPIEKVLPGRKVKCPDGTEQLVTHAWRSRYVGEMLQVSVGGKELSCTPDHLLLTERGWVAAKSLKQGDHLVCVDEQLPVGGLFEDLHTGNGPPQREEEGRFLHILTGLSRGGVPVSAIYFNGQLFVREGDIYAEDVHRVTVEEGESSLAQRIADLLFVGGAHFAAESVSTKNQQFVWLLLPAHGGVCGLCPGGSLLRERPSVPGDCCVCGCALVEPGFLQMANNNRSSNPQVLCDLLDRELILKVHTNDSTGIQDDTATAHKNLSVGALRGPPVLGYTTSAKIVNVVSFPFSGLVYNLAVEGTESYFANGVGSHNCRCGIVPVPPGHSVDRAGNVFPTGEAGPGMVP